MIELHNDISRFIEHTIEEIESRFIKEEDFFFKEIKIPQGKIYLVFETKMRFYLNRLVSYELKALGIIYTDEVDYYYTNFNEDYEKKEEVIKRFVEVILLD